jgi:hypothetical protein
LNVYVGHFIFTTNHGLKCTLHLVAGKQQGVGILLAISVLFSLIIKYTYILYLIGNFHIITMNRRR